MKKQTQYPAAKAAYESRTDLKVFGVRLPLVYRQRIDALAKQHGGTRQVIEAAIDLLVAAQRAGEHDDQHRTDD